MANATNTNNNSTNNDSGGGGGALLGALALSPLGWLADDLARPVPLRDRPPHGDRHDRLYASVSAGIWSVALVVAAIWAQESWSWLAVAVAAAMVVLVVPLRVVISRGGEDRPPQRATNSSGGRHASARIPMVLWASGLAPASSYAVIDRKESDEDGTSGRSLRRIWGLALAVLPTVVLTLDAALGLPLARWVDTLVSISVTSGVEVTGGAIVHTVLALLVLAWAWTVTGPVGRFHAEDFAITGTDAEHPGMVGHLISALGVSHGVFDAQSEIHWNSPRDHGMGFHAVAVSGATAVALDDETKRERIARVMPELELVAWDHRSFRLEPVSDAERARRDNLAAFEELVSGVAGDDDQEQIDDLDVDLDTNDVTWNDDEGGDRR